MTPSEFAQKLKLGHQPSQKITDGVYVMTGLYDIPYILCESVTLINTSRCRDHIDKLHKARDFLGAVKVAMEREDPPNIIRGEN